MTYAALFALLVAVGAIGLGLAHIARDYAEDRERERRYADAWQQAHRHNQEHR